MQDGSIWIAGDAICIVRNRNGFTVERVPADPESRPIVFGTWGELSAYLAEQFAKPLVQAVAQL